MTLEQLKPEIENIANDNKLNGNEKTTFIEHVCDHVIENNITSWDYIHAYVDGLLFKLDFNL